jgi:CRP/FNR family cyclic AMP-dependent transcriptional regulator
MSLQEEVDLLRRIPVFAKIEPSKLKLLAFTSERLKYAANDLIFKQGDPGDAAYIIIRGTADVILETPKGPMIVATLKDNDFVGEISILCDVPRTATIQAKTELEALCISKDLFFRLVREFPEMAVEIMHVLASRLELTTSRLREAVSVTLE